MPTVVTARNGDTLCGLAIDAGFVDCGPVRAEGANSGLLARALKAGDLVTIPDIALKDVSKATEKRHRFIKKNAPAGLSWFVSRSPVNKEFVDLSLTAFSSSKPYTNK